MSWYGTLGEFALAPGLAGVSRLYNGKGLVDNAKGVWEWGQKRPTAPQIGENPYMGQWNDLIGQLQQQARPDYAGPSLAQNAYRDAHTQGMQDNLSMSRGGSAGAARAGMRNMGQMNQKLAGGYSNARLQEQLAMQQQLQGALGGAGNAWFQPQQANLQAQMGTQTNMQQLTGFMQQLLAGAGALKGG